MWSFSMVECLVVQRKTLVSDYGCIFVSLLDVGAHRDFVVLHEILIQQGILFEELVNFPFGDFIEHCLRFTLLTGLFSVQDGLFYTGEIRLFLVQLAGVVAMALFVFVAMTLVFRILQATIGLRVSAAEEINGLDFKENGLVPAYELDRSDDLEDLSQALKAGEAPEGAQEIPLDQAIPDSVMASPQPVGGHALPQLPGVVGGERLLPLLFHVPGGQRSGHLGITGMTITRALGFGIEKGRTEFYRGAKVSAKLLPKVRVEMVVSKVSPRTIIETAKKVLYTGNYGDGKVFVSAIDNAVKIRTGEEGYDALQDYPVVQKK